jgi:hypothetical protein
MIRDAQFWNNKWQQAPITYSGRSLAVNKNLENLVCDVKCFITPNDALLAEIIHDYRLKKENFNATAQAIQQFIVKFLDYADDDNTNECPEFWQFPFESLQSGIGDCEDGAILMASLMIQTGIPAYRVKVAAGYVQESPTAPLGGHAYCIYLADRKNQEQEWVIMDWCYYEDSPLAPESKPLAKLGGYNRCYSDIWFTFNNEYSWNQEGLEIEARRISRSRATLPQQRNIVSLSNVINKIKSKVKD